MPKKHVPKVITLLFIFLLACGASSLETHAYPTATVYIDPPEITGITPGENFDIDFSISDVSDLFGWQVPVFFLSRVINVVDVQEGPFLTNVGSTYFVEGTVTNNYNATHGVVWLACTLIGADHGADGSGVLATVNFVVVGVGETPLRVGGGPVPYNETKLRDSTPMGGEPIPHTTSGGHVRVGGNDIAVTDLKLQKTVANDTNVQINAKVQNYGNYSATFDVTLYYDENEIETQTVTDLPPGNNGNLTFTWDTTAIPKGNYTIKAYAHPVTGETILENNFLIGFITETISGDVNGNYKVDIHDLYQFAKAYNTATGDPKWNPNCDINNDGIINIADMFFAARNYGKEI
ncbi:MAG: dockerin type I domain-containing protein [Candidatus Bathyarchaeota archaeon]|nr:dockerin type I domain-containing protein [Candidatus Bathyarchaeota archaeon]